MNILFVCNGNVARSQEAEIFFNSYWQGGESFAVSGGINAILDKPIDPMVIEVMDEIGYDMSSAKRKFASEAMAQVADKIISFKPANELPEFISSHRDVSYWSVDDPQHQSIDFHRRVRNEVRERVDRLVKELNSQ